MFKARKVKEQCRYQYIYQLFQLETMFKIPEPQVLNAEIVNSIYYPYIHQYKHFK